jgi:heat shock protein HslJ
VAALVALGLAGCGSSRTPVEVASAQLVGVTWELVAIEYDSAPTLTVDDPSRYTVRIEADGRITIRTDCNVCTGTCRVDKNTIALGTLACTRAACPPGSLDAAYGAALATVSGFSVSDGMLVLSFSGGRLRYRAA